MHDLKAAAKRKKKAKRKGPIEDLMESLRQRIRELNAEIAVRDNMGNEVLRILREATGKRDFHSEMEAAEWAAKMLAEARRDGARLDYILADIDGDCVIGDVSAEGFWDDMEAEHIGDEREYLRAWRRAIDSALEAK